MKRKVDHIMEKDNMTEQINEIECSMCGKKMSPDKGLTIGGRILCTKCLKKVTIPILVALTFIVTIVILLIIFWPK